MLLLTSTKVKLEKDVKKHQLKKEKNEEETQLSTQKKEESKEEKLPLPKKLNSEESKKCKEEKLPLPEKSKMIKLNSDMDGEQGSNTYDPSMDSYHPLEHAFWKTEKMYV